MLNLLIAIVLTQTAQGAEGDTRPGQIAIPELRVRSLKAVAGDCERR